MNDGCCVSPVCVQTSLVSTVACAPICDVGAMSCTAGPGAGSLAANTTFLSDLSGRMLTLSVLLRWGAEEELLSLLEEVELSELVSLSGTVESGAGVTTRFFFIASFRFGLVGTEGRRTLLAILLLTVGGAGDWVSLAVALRLRPLTVTTRASRQILQWG